MVVMLVADLFIARPSVAEVVTLDNAGFLEQADRAVDRGEGNPGILGRRATVQFLGIGMVVRSRQDPGNDSTLVGHAKAFGNTELLDTVRHGRVPCLCVHR